MTATPQSPTTLRVACAQLAARDLRHAEVALSEALEAVGEAARMGADLVVLPECSYPAYVLAGPHEGPPLRPDSEVEAAFSARARIEGISVAVGLAQRYRPGQRGASNRAVLFTSTGSLVLSVEKHFLWDFDRSWFSPGPLSSPVEAEGASIGMLVCADARMPEVARSLALEGARLILDPTAWVTTGRQPDSLWNPQPEYLMSVRALENGIWIAAADKIGMERAAVVYAGRSGVFAPDGSVVAMAGSSHPEVVSATVDLSLATGPPIPRRPHLYGQLSVPSESLPVWGRMAEPISSREGARRVALLQRIGVPTIETVAADLIPETALLDALNIDLVAASARANGSRAADAADAIHAKVGVPVFLGSLDADGRVRGAAVADSAGSRVALGTHGPTSDPTGSLIDRTTDIGALRVAVMVGAEGLTPEVPRVLALEGSELLLWFCDPETRMSEAVARTRALENRVYVGLVQTGHPETALSALVDPDGRVTAVGLQGRTQTVTGWVHVPAARLKRLAGETDVVLHRTPELYEELSAAAGATA